MTLQKSPTDRRASPRDAQLAVGLMLVACGLVAATTLIAKLLGPAYYGDDALHPLQVTAGRFVFGAMTLMPFVLAWRPHFRQADWANHALRVLFAWIGVSCLFAASAQMRLSDATAISFLNPIVAMILSIPILGERVGAWRWSAAAVAFAGAVILAQPGSDAFQPIALVALLSALFMGAEGVLVKRLADSEPPLRILAIANVFGAVLAFSGALFVWRWPLPSQWALLAALGAIMVTVQALFVQALRRGDASFVMPFFYTTLIFAGLYDLLIFAELPTPPGWIGAGLIVVGALTIAWRERIRRQQLLIEAERPDAEIEPPRQAVL